MPGDDRRGVGQVEPVDATPASANRREVISNASSSGASMRPGAETDGMRTSASSSRRSSGISARASSTG